MTFLRPFLRTEYVIAFVALAIACVSFTDYKLIRSDFMHGDSAMYFQGTENLASQGVAVSQVQASIVDYQNLNDYLKTPADEIAKNPLPLFGTPASESERSLFLGHAYFVLYPIALLVKAIPVRMVMLSLFVLSFTGMICLAYFVLRRKGVAIAAAALFCLLVVAQPTWWEGLLWGQFYPDRLFILSGFVLMVLASGANGLKRGVTPHRIWLFVAALVCASINERGALVAGLFLVLYVILYWKKPDLDRYYKLALGIGVLCYGLIALKIVAVTDPSYGSFLPTSLGGYAAMFHRPLFYQLVSLFLLVNAPLLILAAFEWRAAVIAAFLMLPNLLGNIGGAEKVGWTTHYVSFFFPSLVWAAMNGYAVLLERAAIKKAAPAAYAVTALFVVLTAMVSPNSWAPISLSFSNLQASFVPTLWQQADTWLVQSRNRKDLKDAADGVVRAVPQNSVVSGIEAAMPLLYQGRTIEYFPKDIDRADYAVIGASWVGGKLVYNGALTYLGADEQKKLDALVLSRMKRDGYDLEHPKFFPAYDGLAVIRRVH